MDRRAKPVGHDHLTDEVLPVSRCDLWALPRAGDVVRRQSPLDWTEFEDCRRVPSIPRVSGRTPPSDPARPVPLRRGTSRFSCPTTGNST